MTTGDVAKITLDTSIGAAGLLAIKTMLPLATACLALVLIILRIVIGWQEFQINRARLHTENHSSLEVTDEPGT